MHHAMGLEQRLVPLGSYAHNHAKHLEQLLVLLDAPHDLDRGAGAPCRRRVVGGVHARHAHGHAHGDAHVRAHGHVHSRLAHVHVHVHPHGGRVGHATLLELTPLGAGLAGVRAVGGERVRGERVGGEGGCSIGGSGGSRGRGRGVRVEGRIEVGVEPGAN
eukprot:scaffold103350_cov65-Phaeocystis_antarctica.AAC.1